LSSDPVRPDFTIDVDALQKKYAEEREKRLRHLSNDPYPELKGQFASFDRDPHVDPDFQRESVTDEVDVLIIGGGLAGLMAGVRLRQQGVKSLRVIDKGGDFGGTWYWNRYPGAACDIESYIYFPLLEDTGYVPSERYSGAGEIQAYLQKLAERYELYNDALFQTVANDLRWNDEHKRWIVRTDRKDEIAARFVIICAGLLSNPKLPKIPGIQSFKGHSFHTSRWDYGYTGGGPGEDMAHLHDKSVAIIGTGSTAVQAIPHLARSAKHLTVFQRTPSSIDPRDNRPTDTEWAMALKPGWQRARSDNFNNIMSGIDEPEDMVADGWTDILRSVPVPTGPDAATPDQMLWGALARMEVTRRHIEQCVSDPATAEALKPWYAYFCKRPCFSDEFLDVFNRPNVTLVDNGGRGVDQITSDGLVVDGKKYPADCIIYATGFDFLAEFTKEAGLEAYGREGLRLSEHWREGPRTLLAVQTDRFPNMFFMRLAQAGGSFNFTSVAEEQSAYIAHVIGSCLQTGAATVEPTKAAVDAWVELVVEKAAPRQELMKTCTPGYYNYEGNPDKARFAALSDLCGEGPLPYFERLRRRCETSRPEGLVFT
jgi:cyclohexanone monooxygenase